jgi:hypothetical protein
MQVVVKNGNVERAMRTLKKKLQKDSILNQYDLDGDNTITDEELQRAKEIKETETKLRKNLAQLRMARYTLIGMGVFTVAMFIVPIERVQALADISNLFYISGAGIVGTYMGTSAYMAKNGVK